jgi:Arc/MetJ-type ribon-helix-helix transcriptional regulator
MKTITVSLPEKMEAEVSALVKNGWFINEQELMRTALQEFIRRNMVKLTDGFMREDIEWALKLKT